MGKSNKKMLITILCVILIALMVIAPVAGIISSII